MTTGQAEEEGVFARGDRVLFTTRSPAGAQMQDQPVTLAGTVRRVWGTRAANVTITDDAGRTFVRLAGEVRLPGAAVPAGGEEDAADAACRVHRPA